MNNPQEGTPIEKIINTLKFSAVSMILYSAVLMLEGSTRSEVGFVDREVLCGRFVSYLHDSQRSTLPRGLSTWRITIYDKGSKKKNSFVLGFEYQNSISEESFSDAEEVCVEQSKTMFGLQRGFVSQLTVDGVELISEAAARREYLKGVRVFDVSLFLFGIVLLIILKLCRKR